MEVIGENNRQIQNNTDALDTLDEFLKSLGKTPNTVRICICDEPEIWNSLLLANIATELRQTSKSVSTIRYVWNSDFNIY